MRPPVPPSPRLRRAAPDDAEVLAAIHRRARESAMPWLARLHPPAETTAWFEQVVLPTHEVTVAVRYDRAHAFSAVHDGWLEQLYVDPPAQGLGSGRALLREAQRRHPSGLRLHVFARNTAARTFYERAGFVRVEDGDGSSTEEGEPDCTYAWPGPRATTAEVPPP